MRIEYRMLRPCARLRRKEVKQMNVPKKVTDFIKLDAGNIGRKAAVVTGAALAASVLGAVLTAPQAGAYDHCDCHADHTNTYHRAGICDYWQFHDHGHYN